MIPKKISGAWLQSSLKKTFALLALLCVSQSLAVADTVVLTGTTFQAYVNLSTTPNRTYDATAWTSKAVGPNSPQTTGRAAQLGDRDEFADGPPNVKWIGGVIIGFIPASWTWTQAHDDIGGVGVDMHNATFGEVAFARIHNVEDGIKPREAPEWTHLSSFLIRDCYFTAIRDDCIENDRFEPGTVQDCLFDGVHTFLSEQKESGFPSGKVSIGPGESAFIDVKRVYVRLAQTNSDAGAGKWFKWKGDAVSPAPNHTLRIEDSVFAVEEQPRSGWSSLDIPAGTQWQGTNNFILWLGATGGYQGPMPGVSGSNIPSSVTFLQGTAAHTKWQQVRNAWLTGHGMASQGSLAADYNPHNWTETQLEGQRIPTTGGDTTPPAAPTGLGATAGSGQVALDWNNNSESDLAGYNVYRSTTSGGPFTTPVNGSLLTTSAYTDTTVTNGTTYFYVATAVDNSANESADSAQVSATPSGSTVAAPVFNPAAGTYATAQSVTITSGTSGASIRYTTNGTTPSPTAGTLYSSPVAISVTTTLKAIAYKTGMTNSSVTTGVYTIGGGGGTTVTFTSEQANDGWVLESAQGSGVGGSRDDSGGASAGLRIGDASGNKQYRAFVSFDTSSLPDGATITAVTLKLKRGTVSGSIAGFTTLVADVMNGGFSGNVALETADFQATATASAAATMNIPATDGAISTGVLNAAGMSAINKTGKTQIRIRFTTATDGDGGTDYLGCFDGDNSTAGNRPVLEVTYQ